MPCPTDLEALTPPVVPSVELADGDDHRHPVVGARPTSARATSRPARRRRRRPASPVVTCRWRRSRCRSGITVTTPDGESLDRDLGEVAQTATGQVPIDAQVLCPDGCRLAGLWLRGTDPFTEHDRRPPRPGRPRARRRAARHRRRRRAGCRSRRRRRKAPRSCPGRATTSASSSTNTGRRVLSRWGDVPDPDARRARRPTAGRRDRRRLHPGRPRRTAGGVPRGRSTSTPCPRSPTTAPWPTSTRSCGSAGTRAPARPCRCGWAPSTRPSSVRCRRRSPRPACPSRSTTTVTEARAQYDRSATGWGLLLGVFTGAMALLVSCLVVGLVAVTSWRGVARDLAGPPRRGYPAGRAPVGGAPRAARHRGGRRAARHAVRRGGGGAGHAAAPAVRPARGRAGARPHAGVARDRCHGAPRAPAGRRGGPPRRPRCRRAARCPSGCGSRCERGARRDARAGAHLPGGGPRRRRAVRHRPRRGAGGAAGPARAVGRRQVDPAHPLRRPAAAERRPHPRR